MSQLYNTTEYRNRSQMYSNKMKLIQNSHANYNNNNSTSKSSKTLSNSFKNAFSFLANLSIPNSLSRRSSANTVNIVNECSNDSNSSSGEGSQISNECTPMNSNTAIRVKNVNVESNNKTLWQGSAHANNQITVAKINSAKNANSLKSNCVVSNMTDSNISLPAIHSNTIAKSSTHIKIDSNISSSTNRSANRTSTSSSVSNSSVNSKLVCDKCDGKHLTEECPYYKKPRDDHPDAQKNKRIGSTSKLPGNLIRSARVVKQPGDGSCLFHSMSYQIKGYHAEKLRQDICIFIRNNPEFLISDTPLRDWIKWDSKQSCADYSIKMSKGTWGGGIEMSICSHLFRVNIHVYERCHAGYKRISAFDYSNTPDKYPIIRVLYCGGVHYGKIFFEYVWFMLV